MAAAPKNIKLDQAANITGQAALIYTQAVLKKAMPLGNATGMTDEERAVIGKWFESR